MKHLRGFSLYLLLKNEEMNNNKSTKKRLLTVMAHSRHYWPSDPASQDLPGLPHQALARENRGGEGSTKSELGRK
jgi:hypothetical protein